MKIDDKIRNEQLQYDINREAAKISAFSSWKVDEYEYLTGKEILPSNQKRVIEQAKFAYYPLGKILEKQRKTIEDQGINQVEALKALKPEKVLKALKPAGNQELESIEGLFTKNMRTNGIKNQMDKI